jgi:peptidoglycan LD-endopeptidase LytH
MHEVLVFLHAEHSSSATNNGVHPAWRYPLEGYTSAKLGRRTRRAYLGEKSYDFFDGNAHAGHPAYDLFIRDRNQDGLDDRKGRPVHVLSVSGGVVICIKQEWSPDSLDTRHGEIIRGGKYVWVYDPASNGIFYYAHLRSIVCHPGQRVEPGSVLGEVGRTGKNAMMKRSGTHLHIMYLEAHDDSLRPNQIFEELVEAGRK